jgi:hypothetical protein
MSPGYFGQSFLTNNLTATWDGLSRATFSLTYRYRDHVIAEGTPHNTALAIGQTDSGTVTIHENGGIFNAALRPSANWNLNGTVEILYDDNAFTGVSPRQTKHYRVHTMYRPRPWATISGAFNDLERHNNTNNNQAAIAAGDDPYEGPIDHVDHSRIVSLGAALSPNERYSFDFNYAYSDVYAATNICYDNGATPTQPGTASVNANGTANVCPGIYTRGSTTQLADWFARDFMDAPTQFGSASIYVFPGEQSPLQRRLYHQLGERQPVLQRCPRGQRFARLHLPVALCQACLDHPSRTHLEGRIQLLRIWRGRPVGSAILQHFHVAHIDRCSLRLSALSNGTYRTALRSHRAAQLSRQQRDSRRTLRV